MFENVFLTREPSGELKVQHKKLFGLNPFFSSASTKSFSVVTAKNQISAEPTLANINPSFSAKNKPSSFALKIQKENRTVSPGAKKVCTTRSTRNKIPTEFLTLLMNTGYTPLTIANIFKAKKQITFDTMPGKTIATIAAAIAK